MVTLNSPKPATRRLFAGAWFSLCVGLALSGCPATPAPSTKPDNLPTQAAATIESKSGSAVTGTATFEQVGNQVKILVEVSGATPGQHGLHIHEKGDCSAADASSAGPHFNPGQGQHGGPDQPMHHAGDFGNLTVGEDGKGRVELTTDQLSVGNGANAVVGRAIVVHAKPDDMTTQPSGNSGDRIGCGVITAKK